MLDRDDIHQNAVVRLIRSNAHLSLKELSRGTNYGVAIFHARVDAHRHQLRDRKCRIASERCWPDQRTRLRGLNSDDPAEICSTRDLIRAVREEVKRLPERERAVMEHCGLATQSIREYAEVLGITERAAAALRDRALKRLRKVARLKQTA